MLEAFLVGSEIVLVSSGCTKAVIYDVEKGEVKNRKIGAKRDFMNCVIIPQVEV